ncbi:hypothetical protein [Mesorhizobium sp. M0296]|uniref:hypothetical protein n=1 Tax=Mesorhizobium sp. M0296 TaxID=2956931 RepID=UPI0033374D7E
MLQRLKNCGIAAGHRKSRGAADRVDDGEHGKLAFRQIADGLECRLPAVDVGNRIVDRLNDLRQCATGRARQR